MYGKHNLFLATPGNKKKLFKADIEGKTSYIWKFKGDIAIVIFYFDSGMLNNKTWKGAVMGKEHLTSRLLTSKNYVGLRFG